MRAQLTFIVCAWSVVAQAQTDQDGVLEASIDACRARADARCLLRLAAFDEAASVLEASADGLPEAVVLRRELGQLDRAYSDALTFVRKAHAAEDVEAVAVEAFDVLKGFEEAGNEAKTVDLLRRYLIDFIGHLPPDIEIVAHAKLGALLTRQSCPVSTFHGACVEIVREMRSCPDLAEGPFRPWPIRNQHTPPRTAYSTDLSKPYPRDERTLRRAQDHLKTAPRATLGLNRKPRGHPYDGAHSPMPRHRPCWIARRHSWTISWPWVASPRA